MVGVRNQSLTVPRYNEHFARGFRYNEASTVMNKFPQSLGTSLNRGSNVFYFKVFITATLEIWR